MKELSIEEKARAYDEALAKARNIVNSINVGLIGKDSFEAVFPELKESEDERIRKKIIATIHLYYGEPLEDEAKEMIDWLEKQGKYNIGISEATKQKLEDNLNKALEKETSESWNEFLDGQGEQKPADYENLNIQQNDFAPKSAMEAIKEEKVDNANKVEQKFKEGDWELKKIEHNPAEWSEMDEEYLNNAIYACLNQYGEISVTAVWLKSLKDRVQLQPQQEWDEEDEKILQGIWDEILANKHDAKECEWKTYDKFLDWLNSLKDKYTWKPSDEQMKALAEALSLAKNCGEESAFDLRTLYEQLKKLREE